MQYDLISRTQIFSLEAIRTCRRMPPSEEGRIIIRQLLRSAFSVGANYRAAVRARSKAEFYSKLCIVVEEVDEVGYWIDLIERAKLIKIDELLKFKKEADELLRIFVTSRKNAKPT